MSAFRQAGCVLELLAAALAAGLAPAIASAQDIPIGATFTCGGEHIYVENCNVRDLSDGANCMVAHPDKLLPNGMNSYTYATRGALKKLLPTCAQPSARQLNAAAAFQKRQQDTYDANEQKAVAALSAPPPQGGGTAAAGQPAPPKNAEERAIRRCVTSGRLPATCTGNSLLGAFGQMLGSVLPGANKEPEPGPTMAGVFEGPGNWRLDFIDGGVLVNCSSLSPNQEAYALDLESGRATLTIKTTPRPLVLALGADSTTLSGPGPVTLDGVVASGYASDVPSNATQKDLAGNLYDSNGNRLVGNVNSGHTVFSSKTVTCPALNLSSRGAGTGIQTMQTDLLKNMFGGEKGPPTPPGIRMHGIFASASTGFSVQFFPESAILGCGPDAARAYPYTVVAGGAAPYIRIDAPDHPLHLAFRPDGSLDPGATGPYQVHGRYATGQDQNDDFTFAPMEQSCNLAALAPSHAIPATGGASQPAGAAPAMTAATTTTAAAPAPVFLLTYMLISPVTGWLGDRFPRKPMIVVAALFWCSVNILTAFVHSFGSLNFRHAALGVGEASFGIFAPALLADFYAEDQRNRVLTIFNIAVPVGAALGFLTGGYVGEHYGWRMAFTVSALPGILIALGIALWMKEPVRSEAVRGKKFEKATVAGLARNPAYLCAVLGYAAVTFTTGGLSMWMPAFFVRMDGRSQSSASFLMGAITVGGGLLGTIVGGAVAQRWSKKNDAALYLVPAWSALAAFVPALVCFFGPSVLHTRAWTAPALAVAIFLIFLGSGPVNAATVNAVPASVRATALAGQLLLIHALGDAVSPTVIGVISDRSNLAVGLGATLIALLAGSAIFFVGARYARPLSHEVEAV